MNTTLSDYVHFNVYSYKGDKYAETYSDIVNKSNEHLIDYSNKDYDTCYALPIDKIVVCLDDEVNQSSGCYDKYSNTNIIWDFGDGTKSSELSAVHWYEYPGTYNIKLTVFDKNLSAYTSAYNTNVYVWNYIPRELEINTNGDYDYTYGDVLKFVHHNLININYSGTEQILSLDVIPNKALLTIIGNNSQPTTIELSGVVSSYNTNNLMDAVSSVSELYSSYGNTLFYLNTPYLEFDLLKFNSWQSYNVLSSIGYNVKLYAENTKSPFVSYNTYISNSYSHLVPTCRFIDNGSTITNVVFDAIGNEVYVKYNKLSGFVICEHTDENAVLAGTYSKKALRFIDEQPTIVIDNPELLSSNDIDISFGAVFDTTGFKTNDNVNSKLQEQWANTVPATMHFKNILSSITLHGTSTLSTSAFYPSTFNACGIDGESYDIYDYKFTSTPINFVARVNVQTDQGIHPYKLLNLFDIHTDGTITYDDQICGKIMVMKIYKDHQESVERKYIDHSNNICNFDFINLPLSSQLTEVNDTQLGGYLKGAIVFNEPIDSIALQISAIGNIPGIGGYKDVTNNIFTDNYTYVIDDTTTTFNVKNIDDSIKIFKQNETFDLANTYSTIAQQPILRDNEGLFNDVLGQIVGDNTNYMNLGVQIFEKISNYVANTQDIDTCNIQHLYDMYNKFDEYIADLNYNWPAELQRDIDLLSIKFNKLYGSHNQFDSDFDNHGYVNNPNYGKNLGEEIDFYTGIIHTNETIIAYEKFSGKYIKLNCNIDTKYIENCISVSNANVSAFALSTYMNVYSGVAQSIKNIQITAKNSKTGNLSTKNITITPLESAILDAVVIYNYSNDVENYRDVWGWNLVLPEAQEFDITDYYTFYRYIPYTNDIPMQSVIDWYNTHNSGISYDMFNFPNTSTPLLVWDGIKRYCLLQTISKNILK